jgi:hypothetical protein
MTQRYALHHPFGGIGQDTTSAKNIRNDDRNGSQPSNGQCIQPRAFPSLAQAHTAKGIPQLSTNEVICCQGTPRVHQGCQNNRNQTFGYTKGHRQGITTESGYTKATAKELLPNLGTPRPPPRNYNRIWVHQGHRQGITTESGYTKATAKELQPNLGTPRPPPRNYNRIWVHQGHRQGITT